TSVTTYATGGGGGGGGGYVAPLPAATAPVTTVTQPATTPAAPAVGQVLGAQAFRFTEDLSEGMQNDNVTELQNRLTSEGVYSGPVTGYFGSLTLAGVKEYQAKHSLPTTGFVGPMTRAELNAALTSAASQGQVLGAQTTGTAETIARIQGIIQQLQAEGGQEKIISVLQMVLAFLGQ
ncbi:peptidoglycan-binding protein, partial [Patescibacteria group bacterium]|nr:peptidoglycan-binding protein [Patescibacteria group bacterium]